MAHAFIYKLTFLPAQKHLIGAATCDPAEMWLSYFTSHWKIHQLIERYGAAAFRHEILDDRLTVDQAKQRIESMLSQIVDRQNYFNDFSKYDDSAIQAARESRERQGKQPLSDKRINALIVAQRKATAARRGMKDSDDVKAKRTAAIRKAVAGRPKPNKRKPIYVNDTWFPSQKAAAAAMGVARQTVQTWLKNGIAEWA